METSQQKGFKDKVVINYFQNILKNNSKFDLNIESDEIVQIDKNSITHKLINPNTVSTCKVVLSKSKIIIGEYKLITDSNGNFIDEFLVIN